MNKNDNILKNSEINNINNNNNSNNNVKIIEYDVNGKEICFLFRKFGKCRYGNKCKKSHILNSTDTPSTVLTPLDLTNTQQNSIVQKLLALFNFKTTLTTSLSSTTFKTIIPVEKQMINNNVLMLKSSKKLIFTQHQEILIKNNNKNRIIHRINNNKDNNNNNNNSLLSKSITKSIKKHHWKVKSLIDTMLNGTLPWVYSKSIINNNKSTNNNNSNRILYINFNRLRPFVYILLKSVLSVDIEDEWLQCMANTIVSYLQTVEKPIDLERKLISWGIVNISSRKLVVLLWNTMVQSAASNNRISQLIQNCEKEIRSSYIQAIDYARACQFTLNHTRFSNELIDKSVKSLFIKSQATSTTSAQTTSAQTTPTTTITLNTLEQINESTKYISNWKEKKMKELELLQSFIK